MSITALGDAYLELLDYYNVINIAYYRNAYHYTSPEGFLGILDKDKPILWFSRYDCLNDTDECNNILYLFEETCSVLYKNGKIDIDFYNLIKDIKPEKYVLDDESVDQDNGISLKNISEYKEYICCFSQDNDSLPMWNYYMKNNKYRGYNIGFYDLNFIEYKLNKKYNLKFDAITIIYENEKKKEIIEKSILTTYTAYIKGSQANKIVKENDFAKFILRSFLNQFGIIFKNESFKQENEVRLIAKVPILKENTLGVKHRTYNGYIIPYIEIQFDKADVIEIMIGPLMEKDIARDTVKNMLQIKGYTIIKDENINVSKVPIRF